jgi:hypothetical protein
MHGVICTYSGSGAKELMDLIVERQDEIEALIRGVTGFVSYALLPPGRHPPLGRPSLASHRDA